MPDITDGMNELEFLASKAAAGKLVIVSSSVASTGAAASYTPASGTTFILYRAKAVIDSKLNGNSTAIAQLRNNSTVQDVIFLVTGGTVAANTGSSPATEFIIRGDQLIGDGSKKYDINISSNANSETIYGTIIGYLL